MRLLKAGSHEAVLREIGVHAAWLGARAWVVGGCARDWLLGKSTRDIDIVAEADCLPLADFCVRRYKAQKTAFSRFGTFRLALPDGLKIDFARARREVYRAPAALPEVSPAKIEDDLFRRDFTVNAAACSITPDSFGELLDPFCAAGDIRKGVVRILHGKSFADDPTRLFRACRFCGRFGWKMDTVTSRLFARAVKLRYPGRLSRERIRNELLLILAEKNAAGIFRLMDKSGLSGFIYPGLEWSAGAAKLEAAAPRLGALACLLGPRGTDFIRSLNLERALSRSLKAAVEIYAQRKSPFSELTAEQRRILKAVVGAKTGPAALKKRFVDGKMLGALGLSGSKEYARIIDAAAAAQWRGEFSTPAQAARWAKQKLIIS